MGKRKKNTNKQLKIILVVIVVVLLVGFGVYSYKTFNNQYLNDLSSLEEAKVYLEDNFPTEVDTNLKFTDIDENIKITYNSNNKAVIDEAGNVIRPSYINNDAKVEIEVLLEIIPDNALANMYYNIRGGANLSLSVTVTVLKLEQNSEEKIQVIESQLFVPKITKTDINLQQNIHLFSDASVIWKSNNEAVITSDGKIMNTGYAEFTATIKVEDEEKMVSFPIEVVSKFADIVEAEEMFENTKFSSSYDTPTITNDFTFSNAVLNTVDNNSYLRMRAHTASSITVNNEINDVTKLSFTYWAITDSAFTNDVILNVMTKNKDELTYSIFKQIKIIDNDKHNIEVDFSSLTGNTSIKIESVTGYSTMFIALDDLKIERKLNSVDIEKSILEVMPDKLTSSYLLPLSTPYGGVIEWVSDSEAIITSAGVVKRQAETNSLYLTAKINGVLDEELSLKFLIKVLGTDFVTPVEVFFIDLGKYGDADNGESIYFKIGDVDVLVDAGDNMNSTKQAISEVIDANSEDKILDYVIATHPDADHIGSMKHVFDTYDVLNIVYFEGDHTTQLYQNFVTSVTSEALVSECTILQAYDNKDGCTREVVLGEDVKIEFLNTGYYTTTETNGRSVVFVLEAYGTRLLMTGDADNGSGRTLESNYMNSVGNIDILKVVHHATREGTTIDFLQAVDPEVAIITNGNYFGNKHGHPTFEAINRIYQYDNKIGIYAVVGGNASAEECTYTTSYKCNITDRFVDRNGTITLNIDSDGYTFTSEYNDEMIELSSTAFWMTHPKSEYDYAN